MVESLSNVSFNSAQQLHTRAADAALPGQTNASFVSDPLAMMSELAEEVGFLAADRLQDEVDEAEDEKYLGFRQVLLEKNLEFAGADQEAISYQAEQLVAKLRYAGTLTREQVFSALKETAKGTSQNQLATLAAFLESADGAALTAHLPNLLETFVEDAESNLVASMNISAELAQRQPRVASDEAERILYAYEDAVVSSESVLQVFQKLGSLEGQDKITDWRGFLTESVAADLKGHPSSQDREKLQVLLIELKGFRIFNTLASGLDRLQERYLEPFGLELPAGTLMQQTLDFVEQPIREYPKVEALSSRLPPDKQVLFLQDFRDLLKSLPDFAYSTDQQKAQLLVPLQQKIDDLTYSEFDE